MHEVSLENLGGYLHDRGVVPRDESPAISELGGGVSNVVYRVAWRGGEFVVKQSRPQLRTQAPWFSRLERIYREIDVLRILETLLPAGTVPAVLFEDRENYLFVMQAAPAAHVVWKRELLDGMADASIAARLGEILATVHRESAGVAQLADQLGDRRVFEELRIDPYYRHTAAAHPQLKRPLIELIERTRARSLALVLGDFSPKNVLVTRGEASRGAGIMLVDFETGHYGDPAFDLGFFLTHLMLKSVYHAERAEEFAQLASVFWTRYSAGLKSPQQGVLLDAPQLESEAVQHLAACMLARVDGKSPVEYLNDRQREFVRRFCCGILNNSPRTLPEFFSALLAELFKTR